MVLLTMTSPIVAALRQHAPSAPEAASDGCVPPADAADEPLLTDPKVGNPISHVQIVRLWREGTSLGHTGCSLEGLLVGARLYVPPPPPKPEPTEEFKALMARLRRDEEERKYERMMAKPSPLESMAHRHSGAAAAMRFEEANRPLSKDDMGDDDVTLGDVHRQLMLLLNFVVSIFGCAATLWIVARWWSTPARLFLTLGGSALVGVAEVAVYSGYIWHLSEAKKKDAKTSEVRQVVQTWSIGGQAKDDGAAAAASPASPASPAGETSPVLLEPKNHHVTEGPRKRNVKSSS